MARWIAFLRGVNVGGNNILPMTELRSAMQADGYQAVETYIQSGNIVFDASEADAASVSGALSALIENRFGFRPDAHILSAEQYAGIIAANPYTDEGRAEPKSVHLYFLKAPAHEADLDALETHRAENEAFTLTDQAFYLLAPDGIGRSALADKLDRLLRARPTGRNFRTVMKVAALAGLA